VKVCAYPSQKVSISPSGVKTFILRLPSVPKSADPTGCMTLILTFGVVFTNNVTRLLLKF